MKTQIIFRLILVTIALFICSYNNGSKTQKPVQHASHTASKSASENAKEQSKTTIPFSSNTCSEQHASPIIPEADKDHDYDSFDFKHHEKRAAFWKSIANKVLAAIYYIAIIVAFIINFS